MVSSYWSIGQLIVENEQNGNERAEYGKAVFKGLSKKLTAEFGKGFDESNLRYMRLFHQIFSIVSLAKVIIVYMLTVWN